MLQQTQTSRVEAYYERFIRRFPSVASLARAPLAEVLREWQGLGYNRRAKSLLACAKILARDHKGKFPRLPEELEKLPGIGPYTAHAVATFSFGYPGCFLETNIRTVFLHEFFNTRLGVTDKELLPVIASALYKKDPRRWYYALMDYGAHLKRSGVRAHRKSAHYRKQSPFVGSNRQLRAKILRSVLSGEAKNISQLSRSLNEVPSKVKAQADILAREGLIGFSSKGFYIPREVL